LRNLVLLPTLIACRYDWTDFVNSTSNFFWILQNAEVGFSKTLKKRGVDTLKPYPKRQGERKVGLHVLPKTIRKMLKEIYDYLNKRTYASNLDSTKRKFFYVTTSVIALILLSGFMLAQVMSAVQISSTISNVGALNLSADIGVYWDASFTERTSAIDWGTLDPGATKSFSIYIQNEGNNALTLSMSTSNWSPPTASNYLTMTWNYNGQTINPNEYIHITLTLTISASITGFNNFSFNLNIVGTE
jgi:hypothetical protein